MKVRNSIIAGLFAMTVGAAAFAQDKDENMNKNPNNQGQYDDSYKGYQNDKSNQDMNKSNQDMNTDNDGNASAKQRSKNSGGQTDYDSKALGDTSKKMKSGKPNSMDNKSMNKSNPSQDKSMNKSDMNNSDMNKSSKEPKKKTSTGSSY